LGGCVAYPLVDCEDGWSKRGLFEEGPELSGTFPRFVGPPRPLPIPLPPPLSP